MKLISFAVVYTVASLLLGGWVGTLFMMPFMAAMWIEATTGVLEISMSADNAVVISGMLRKQTPFWQRNYMIFGMPIAGVGMRFAVPILIVSMALMINPISTLMLAIHDPDAYSKALEGVSSYITAFGVCFLTPVFADFMCDDEKDHWIGFIERPLASLNSKTYHYGLSVIVLMVSMVVFKLSHNPDPTTGLIFIIAGIFGILSHLAIKMLSEFAEDGSCGSGSGFMGFLAMEAVDASFSFDGVIGAFAITKNIFLVAIGLMIGAFWTRTLVIMLAKSTKVGELKYLPHGAFWNIAALIMIMVASIATNVPAWIPGLFSFAFLGKAVYDSFQVVED